jgi:hypothetical protein
VQYDRLCVGDCADSLSPNCTGISTHHRPWIAEAVVKYPQFDVVITPYSAGSHAKPHTPSRMPVGILPDKKEP